MRVITVNGLNPQINCVLVQIGSDKFVYDAIKINYVWITLNNTDMACISNIPAKGLTLLSLLNYPSTQEIVLLNVTAQYYRMVLVNRGCTRICSAIPFSVDLENKLIGSNQTLFPIYNDLNQLGKYCVNGGTIDTSYNGSGYMCICPSNSTFFGPSCEYLEVHFDNTISYFNIFSNEPFINLRFSIFSNGISGTVSILTIKNSAFQRLVEIIILESTVVLKTENKIQSSIPISIDNVNWYDVNLVLSQTNATLRINYLTTTNLFNSTYPRNYKSFYLLINEDKSTSFDICLKNMIADSKLIDFNNANYVSCCQSRCSCLANQDCDCRPFISKGNSACYCKPGYIASGLNCISNNVPMSQITDSITAAYPISNNILTKVDFGFQTLSTLGSLLGISFVIPPVNVSIQIINNNLTLNVANNRVRNINYNVSNGLVHNVTLMVKSYSLEMILDNNLNYTVFLTNWYTSASFPTTGSTSTASVIVLGPLIRAFNSTINNLTTCFSVIRLNSIGASVDTFPSLNSLLSSQCSNGPRCNSGIVNCPTNQVCKDDEWQNTKCICIANFTSINSVCTYNLCVNNPCLNGGSCYYNAGILSYSCICISSFTGTNCQNSVGSASLWWIAVLIVFIIFLIILIILIVYCCCCYIQTKIEKPNISKINENMVTYNENAGESDYTGRCINFDLLLSALKDITKPPLNTKQKPIEEIMKKKKALDLNNNDLVLDHPLDYGYEGNGSDNESISSIGSKSQPSQIYDTPLENPDTNVFNSIEDILRKV